jgi:hypothetical protein
MFIIGNEQKIIIQNIIANILRSIKTEDKVLYYTFTKKITLPIKFPNFMITLNSD